MTLDAVTLNNTLAELCDEYRQHNGFNSQDYQTYGVKRGLRNPDGTGVMAGLTNICNVHGFLVADGERIPDEGKLTYRGINVNDIVEACVKENRFGFEETAWLLLFGSLPTKEHLEHFKLTLGHMRELPENFAEDMILKFPSRDIMNKLARSVLVLYSFDPNPDDTSLGNIMRQSIQLIASLPTIMTYAYQVKRRAFDKQSMFFHPIDLSLSTSESILRALRPDMKFTDSEAKLLDLCMILHAEHGGGNNSTFSTRVLSSSGTDTYSAIAAAIGSLKGPRHGGANLRVRSMMEDLKAGVKDWTDEDEVADYLAGIIRKEHGDGSGLIYGFGHAIYTLSDPRAVILKKVAGKIAEEKNMVAEFNLYKTVEKLTPSVFEKVKGNSKVICANVDFYSGFVYDMLGIPSDLFTPLFAVSRIAGWCAHRIEEVTYGGRIIRPAYRSMVRSKKYTPISERNA
ncbi:MAG: citrate/2-methylcitrate synthase [Clostridia bacterium]|nr:citrate/2-methylcitrate synthase [Clostridia bacterium]